MGRIRTSLWCVAAIGATLLLWACGDEPGPTEAPSFFLAPPLQEPGDEPPPSEEPSPTPDACETNDCTTGGGGGGGGGTDTGTSCSSTDPDCLKPLTSEEQQKVSKAIQAIVDSIIECALTKDVLWGILARGHIYKGNPLIEGVESPGHVGEWAFMSPPGGGDHTHIIHVDEDFLAAATGTALAAVLAHEGFHAQWYSHPTETDYPYATPPFNKQDKCAGVN